MASGIGSVVSKDVVEFIKSGSTKQRTSLVVRNAALYSPRGYGGTIIMVPATMQMPDGSKASVFLVNSLRWGVPERLRVHISAARMAANETGMEAIDGITVGYNGQQFNVYTTPKS